MQLKQGKDSLRKMDWLVGEHLVDHGLSDSPAVVDLKFDLGAGQVTEGRAQNVDLAHVESVDLHLKCHVINGERCCKLKVTQHQRSRPFLRRRALDHVKVELELTDAAKGLVRERAVEVRHLVESKEHIDRHIGTIVFLDSGKELI